MISAITVFCTWLVMTVFLSLVTVATLDKIRALRGSDWNHYS